MILTIRESFSSLISAIGALLSKKASNQIVHGTQTVLPAVQASLRVTSATMLKLLESIDELVEDIRTFR